MGKKKKKKVKVWCSENPKPLKDYPLSGGGGYGTNRRIDGDEDGALEKVRKDFGIPKKVKCPDCGKKFRPRIRECHDYGCWHLFIPAHKKWTKE